MRPHVAVFGARGAVRAVPAALGAGIAAGAGHAAGAVWLPAVPSLAVCLLPVLIVCLGAWTRARAGDRVGDRAGARIGCSSHLVLAVLLAFALHGALVRQEVERHSLAPGPLGRGWVVGRVEGLPEHAASGTRFRWRVVRSNLGLPAGSLLEASLPRTRGRGQGLRDGILLCALADVRGGEAARNPGGFNERAAFLVRGTAGHARLVAGTALVRAGPGVLDLGARFLSPLRAELLARVREQERGRAGAFLAGFLLGDRSALDAESAEGLRRAGALHLLAISGMHVVLVLALLGRVLSLVGLRGRRAAWARFLGGSFYCLLAGGSASVWRAGASAALVEVGAMLGRRMQAGQALSVATLGLLLLRPAFALDAGFQLSALATWGLLAIGGPTLVALERGISSADGPVRRGARAVRMLAEPFVSTLAAQLAALPVLAAHFGVVSTMGLLANLLLVPVTNLALVAGVLGLVASCLPSGPAAPIASGFWIVADAGALATLRVSDALARAPLVFRPLGSEPWALAALAGSLAFLTGALPRVTPRGGPRATLPLVVGIGLAGALAILVPTSPRERGALVWTLLDVGQGDGMSLLLPDGRALVVDGGDLRPGFDVGRRVLLPALRHRGVYELDAVVATHGDRDHVGGLPSLLRDLPASRLLGPSDVADSLIARVEARGGAAGRPAARSLTRGDVVLGGPQYAVRVLWPPPGFRADPAWTTNRESVVLLVELFARDTLRILLTGDADTLVERRLIEAGLPRASVLKVGHHGSRTSSGSLLLGTLGAHWALASVGRTNRFGHPHADVVSRIRAHGAIWRSTADSGAVEFRACTDSLGRWRMCVGLASKASGAVPCGSHDVAPHASIGRPGLGPGHELPRPRRRRRPGRSGRHNRGPPL